MGLGHLLNLDRDLNDLSLVFVVMIVIVAVGMVFDRVVFGTFERWVNDPWGLGAR